MSRVINGTLYVDVYNPTANPGEYTFTNAIYENQADATGNGAYDLQLGFLLYTQATDLNTAMPVPGVFHRYKVTAITVIDPGTIDATILWDEARETTEIDAPTNGAYGIICEPSAADDFGSIAAVGVYYNLNSGADIGSYVSDIRNKIDSDAFKNYTNVEGTTINKYDIVFESSAGNVQLAKADDAIKPGTVIGIVYDTTIADSTIGRILIKRGYRMKGFTGLTPSEPCYISRTTAGTISQNLTGWVTGEHVVYLGDALASDELEFNPEYGVEY
jgi:hypothetical protein